MRGSTERLTFRGGVWIFDLLRILIIPDKFKGTLTARAAAEAMAAGWGRARPHDELELLPMSDGGDGFGGVMRDLLGCLQRRVKAVDAAHRLCVAHWGWAAGSKTALMESAAVVGLAMLPPGRYHPFQLDSFGLGMVLRATVRAGAKECLVGLGGSATNDGGFGMARALGWEFLTRQGAKLQEWTELDRLASVQPPRKNLLAVVRVRVAVDVQNPLLGSRGATRIYGPQKGLRPRDFVRAERCLSRLAQVVARDLGRDDAAIPGAGAAGGLGFGLMAFAGAELEPGFELFARHALLSSRMAHADVVITGEGAIDRSSLMGKGVGQVVKLCRDSKVPCIGLAGQVAPGLKAKSGLLRLGSLTELTSEANARTRAAYWLEQLAAHTAKALDLSLVSPIRREYRLRDEPGRPCR